MNNEMQLNEYGKIAEKYWREIQRHFPYVELKEYAVMPNHVHGIITIVDNNEIEIDRRDTAQNDMALCMGVESCMGVVLCRDMAICRGTACRAPTADNTEQFGKPVSGSIATIIRSFKSAVTRKINEAFILKNKPIWQRNYYEHIIRNEKELNNICGYIINNPAKWEQDENNPENIIANKS
ncbi:MAG: transposase [Spirochaetota bacterium]